MNIRNKVERSALDLAEHHPDCSLVSDDNLRHAITSHWPLENGTAKIPYSFSSDAWLEKYGVKPVEIDPVYAQIYKASVKAALDQWAQISQGLLQFYEATPSQQKLSKGIFFNLADATTLHRFKAGAFTIPRYDDKGNLKQALIYYPVADWFWKNVAENYSSPDDVNTLNHEIGHALGFEHLHEYPEILNPMTITPDGAFCSVMPYENYFSNTNAACKKFCRPRYAMFPGPLDERMVQLAYNQNDMRRDVENGEGVMGPFFTSALSSGFYAGIHSFAEKLAIKSDEPLLSKRTAAIIADSSMLAATIYLDAPVWSSAVFAASAVMKYLPDTLLPDRVKAIINSDFPSAILINGAISLSQGASVIPLAGRILMSVFGSVVGTYVGSYAGNLGAQLAKNPCSFFYSGLSMLYNKVSDWMSPESEAVKIADHKNEWSLVAQ